MCSIHLFLPQKADLVKLFMKILQYHLEGRNMSKLYVEIVGSDLSMIVNNECDLDIWLSTQQYNNL